MMKFGSGAGVWLSFGRWRLYRDKFFCPLDLSRVLLLYSHIFYGQMQLVSVALSCFLRLREVHLDLQSRAVIQHLRCAHLAWLQSSSYRLSAVAEITHSDDSVQVFFAFVYIKKTHFLMFSEPLRITKEQWKILTKMWPLWTSFGPVFWCLLSTFTRLLCSENKPPAFLLGG